MKRYNGSGPYYVFWWEGSFCQKKVVDDGNLTVFILLLLLLATVPMRCYGTILKHIHYCILNGRIHKLNTYTLTYYSSK
jgi:hypothetical protein